MSQPGLEFGSRVVQAWAEGRRLREQINQAQAQMAQAQSEQEQQQAQFQERQKLEQERLKQEAEGMKQRDIIAKAQLEIQKAHQIADAANQKTNQAINKAQLLEQAKQQRARYGGGPSVNVDVPEMGTSLRIPQDEQPWANIPEMEDLTIEGKSLPLIPYEQQNRNLAQNRLRVSQAQHEEEMRQRALDREVDRERAELMYRGTLNRMNASDDKVDKRDQQATTRFLMAGIDTLNRSKTIGRYANALYAFDSVKDINLANPGIADVDLLYKYLHTIDDSVVRPSEVTTVMDNANTLLERLGIKVKGLVQKRHFLDPMTRKTILTQMEQNVMSRKKVADAELGAKHEQFMLLPGYSMDLNALKAKTMAGAYANVIAEEGWKPISGSKEKPKTSNSPTEGPYAGYTKLP